LLQHGRIFPHIAAAGLPAMPSFDTVLQPDLIELRNAVEQSNKEIGTRFDFKGSDARVELVDKDKQRSLLLYADSEFQIARCATCCWPSSPSAASTFASPTSAPSSKSSAATRSSSRWR
jgi:hypothetical protein